MAITRDPYSGQITANQLDPAKASEMGKARWKKERGVLSARVKQLLTDRGIDPETADEGMRSLAEIAIEGRSGAVSALRYLDALTGNGPALLPGEPCPVCGRSGGNDNKGLNVPDALLIKLIGMLEKRLARDIPLDANGWPPENVAKLLLEGAQELKAEQSESDRVNE